MTLINILSILSVYLYLGLITSIAWGDKHWYDSEAEKWFTWLAWPLVIVSRIVYKITYWLI